MNMTKFDMFYDIYDPNSLINFTETQPYNDRFDSLGMSSVGFFDVLGSVLIIIISTAIMQIVRPLAMRLIT